MEPKKIIYSIFILFLFTLFANCTSTVDTQIKLKPFLPGRHGWDLKQVTIADTDNNVLEFKRVDCVWVVGNENKPSNESKITTLADKLVTMVPAGLVTQESDRYMDFKVADANFSRKVILTFKDKSSLTMLIGSPALTKPAYVRLADKKEVYWIDDPLFKQINLNSGTWLALEKG
jgi:hypothetical protein